MMRLRIRLLEKEPNSQIMETICLHYGELRSELVAQTCVVRNSQTSEDILHDAIYHVACEAKVSDKISDILEEVRHKFRSLNVGLVCEERDRKEILSEEKVVNYGKDNETEEA